MFRRHPILSLVTFVYLAVVGWITLGPQPIGDGGDAFIWRVVRFFSRHDITDWITYQRIEFSANVAMFVPIGMFFLLLFGRRFWLMSVIAGVALTCTIEFAQLFLPDRVSDVRDIVGNSVGTLVGVLIALVLTADKARQYRRADAAKRHRTRRVRERSGAAH